MKLRLVAVWLSSLLLLIFAGSARAFDHTHAMWDALLRQNVVLINNGNASQLSYTGMQGQRPALTKYLGTLSAVSSAEYGGWNKSQKLAFLINAYNAYTVELILTRYPGIHSIKDLGSIFQSPWKQKFIPLFGDKRSLDDIEHGLIRAPGAFDDPRIHFAVVCASVGCPMLRNEAFTGEKLDAQLADAMRRFLSDHKRNRFDASNGKLEVSKIFDWYGKDFAQGNAGFDSLAQTFAKFADQLTESAEGRERIRHGDYALDFLDYDWNLNDRAN